jgi:threonine synthase
MGLPVGEVVLATNANRIISDYLAGSEWLPRESIPTLASAMDVGNPSNMERLIHLFGSLAVLNEKIRVFTVSDEDIERQIRKNYSAFGFAICPHTATASYAYEQLSTAIRESKDWIIVATAHPAKFELIVEPLIGDEIPLPASLQKIQSKSSRSVSINADMDSFEKALHDRLYLNDGV